MKGEPMKKVGILGGTFNPVHLAHLMIAETAFETLCLDEVLFVPTGCSYMKNASEIASSKDRVNMLGLALEDNPHFALSTIEIDRKGNSYTYQTLQELKELHPDWELYLIMGADNLFDLESWKNPEIIMKYAHILAAVRGAKKNADMTEQMKYLKNKYGAQITLLPIRHIDISSTSVREKITNKKTIRYIVPDKVCNYIERHKLYQEIEGI